MLWKSARQLSSVTLNGGRVLKFAINFFYWNWWHSCNVLKNQHLPIRPSNWISNLQTNTSWGLDKLKGTIVHLLIGILSYPGIITISGNRVPKSLTIECPAPVSRNNR